ncbi:MAG: hypothetical protein H0W56_00140 [Acidothermales bacterium]|nr:hypothetical protein [Acidothermales bacterium]
MVVEPWDHVFAWVADAGLHQLRRGAGALVRRNSDDVEACVPGGANEVGEHLPVVLGHSLCSIYHEQAMGSGQLGEELVYGIQQQGDQFELVAWKVPQVEGDRLTVLTQLVGFDGIHHQRALADAGATLDDEVGVGSDCAVEVLTDRPT